jgi:hypothetical protein
MISLPMAMSVTFLARPLVFIVGGAQYLDVPGVFTIFGRDPYMGGADLAFQVIIWSIPIGFVNSVTQYVLIAVNQQHYLTRAFVLGVVFNIVGNLILIPRLGYVGARWHDPERVCAALSLLLQRAAQCRRGALAARLRPAGHRRGADGRRLLRS